MNENRIVSNQEAEKPRKPLQFTTRNYKHNSTLPGEYSISISFGVRHCSFITHGNSNEVTLYELSLEDIEALAAALFKEAARVQISEERPA